MAEYGILLKINDIKGPCQVPDYKDNLLASSLSFGSNAQRTGGIGSKKQHTSVDQSSVTLELQAGSWTAELLQALYSAKQLGDVTITQTAQAVGKDTKAAPSVIQKLILKKAVLSNVGQAWSGDDGPRMINITLEFETIHFETFGKVADYTLRNITA